jgi:WhiB family redox-sensing transcriptional regulator
LVDIPSFMDGSQLCAQVDPEIFHPDLGRNGGDARAVCAACPLREACLAYALEHDERYGVWGGTSPQERRAMQGKRAKDTPRAQPAPRQAPAGPRLRSVRCLKTSTPRYPTRADAEQALVSHPSTARVWHCTSCCGFHITTKARRAA